MKFDSRRLIFSFICGISLSFAFLFTACKENVGLGESVDTESPTLSITYPPSAAQIRGTFVFAGTCSDDKYVESVKLTIKNTTTKETFTANTVALGEDKKTWSVRVNDFDDTNASYYNGWQLPDGKYELSVVAYDNAGHSSDSSSRQFEIDNTAPVFILTGPGSTTTPKAYGSSFSVAGTIADEHTISSMAVTIYDSEKNVLASTDTTPYTIQNVSTAGGTNVTVLRMNASNGRYESIYGQSTGTVNFYCTVYLEDGTHTYTEPVYTSNYTDSNTSAGNRTSAFFLNDDIYNSLLSSNSYGLSASDLMSILNGNYAASDDTSARAVAMGNGNLTREQLAQVRTLLSEKFVDTKDEYLCFSLNPEVNPSYTVAGMVLSTAPTATSGSKATIVCKAGLDQTTFLPGTLKAYIKKFTKVIPSASDYESFILNPAEDPDAILVASNADSTESSVESYNWTIALPELSADYYYVIGLSGQDMDGNEFRSDGVFGFKGALSGTPPVVTITKPGLAQTVFANSAAVKFIGYADTTDVDLETLEISVAVTDLESGTPLGNFTGSYDMNSTSNTISIVQETDENDDVHNKYTFNFTDGTGYENFEVLQDSGKLYSYAATIVATDTVGNTVTETRTINVDAAAPVVEINTVSPSVSGSLYDKSENTYVNGQITIAGNVVETNLYSLSYTVYQNGEPVDGLTGISLPTNTTSFKFNLDTTTLTDMTKVDVVVTARDKALASVDDLLSTTYDGNNFGEKAMSSVLAGNDESNGYYTICQDSDNPIVILGNADSSITTAEDIQNAVLDSSAGNTNIFNLGNSLSATITDDDGISSVTVGYRTLGSSDAYTELSSRYTASTTSLTSALPDAYGEYEICITAIDKIYTDGESYGKKITTFAVALDDGAPTFSSVSPTDGGYYNSAITVTGNVKDASGKITIRAEGAGTSAGYATDQTTEATSVALSDSVTIPNASGSYEAKYTATDKYNQSATYTIKYNVDKIKPLAEPDFGSTSTSEDSSWVTSSSSSINVYAKDVPDSEGNASGLASVTAKVEYTNSNSETVSAETSLTAGDIVTDNSSEYNGYYKYTGSLVLGQGVNTITVVSKDKAGNSSTDAVRYVQVDSEPPVITQPAVQAVIKAEDTALTNGLSIDVTVTDTGSGVRNVWIDESSANANDPTGAIAKVTSGTNNVYTLVVPVANLTTGTHKFYIHANDALQASISSVIAVAIDTEAPVLSVTGVKNITINSGVYYFKAESGCTIEGAVSDTPAGVKNVYIKAVTGSNAPSVPADVTDVDAWTTTEGWATADVTTSGTWTCALSSFAENDVNLTVYAVAVDSYGNATDVSANTITIFADSAAPVISGLNSIYHIKGTADAISAAVSDTSFASASLTMVSRPTGLSDAAPSVTATPSAGGATVSFTPITASDSSKDGKWVYKLTVTDKAGYTTSQNVTVVVDTTAPDLVIKNALNTVSAANRLASDASITESNAYISENAGVYTYSLSGTWNDYKGNDCSGTAHLYYTTLSSATTATAVTGDAATGWKLIDGATESDSGSTNWSYDLTVTEGIGKYLAFYAEDNSGNKTEIQSFSGIKLDFGAPAVSLTSPAEVSAYYTTVPQAMTFECSDTHGISSFTVTVKKDGQTYTATDANAGITITVSGDTYSKTAVVSLANDGSYEITARATDVADRTTSSSTYSTVIDTVKPLWKSSWTISSTDYTFKVANREHSPANWYAEATLKFEGCFEESGSGVDQIFYWLVTPGNSDPLSADLAACTNATGSLSGENKGTYYTFNPNIDGFEASTNANRIFFVAKDVAGNVSEPTSLDIYRDDGEPEVASKFYTFIDNPTSASEHDAANGTVLANGKKALTIYGTTSDAASGIGGISFYLGGKTDSDLLNSAVVTYTTSTDNLSVWENAVGADYAAYDSSNATPYTGWRVVIPASDIDTKALYVRVQDKAGNSQTPQILTLNKDDNSPEIFISTTSNSKLVRKSIVSNGTTTPSTPDDGDVKSINGDTTFSGTAQDDYTIASIKLYYSTSSDSADYSSDTLVDTLYDTAAYSWSFDKTVTNGITMLDNATYEGTAQTAYFKFVALDKAANESVYVYKYSVDPNADRPELNITNLASGVSGNSGNILKYDTVITGSLTDDDDLTGSTLKIYEIFSGTVNEVAYTQTAAPTTAEAWANYSQPAGTLSYSTTTGDWSYTPLDSTDGEKELYIYFKDSEGGVFWTAYNLSASGTYKTVQDKTCMPRIYFKRSESDTYGSTAALKYSTDGNSPEISSVKIAYGATEAAAEAASFASINDIYGGVSRRYARFQIIADDANGISTVSATIGGTDLSLTGTATAGTVNQDADSTWISNVVDLYTFGNTELSVVAKAVDGSGLYSNKTESFLNDYEVGSDSIRITTPKMSVSASGTYTTIDTLTGSIEITGTSNDGTGSGIASIAWMVPAAGQDKDTIAAMYNTIGSRTYDAYLSDIAAADTTYDWHDWATYGNTNSSLSDWEFDFDGTSNILLKDVCNTTNYNVDLTNFIYTIPVLFRMEDNLGNVSVITAYSIKFNPNADWPTARIIYPTSSGTDSKTKVGGTVRVSGSATDNNSVSAVYVQISTTVNAETGEPVWSSTDSAITDGHTTAVSKVGESTTYNSVVSLTSLGLSGLPEETGYNSTTDGWGILASNTASWFLEINKYGELDNKDVYIRACAVDYNENAVPTNMGLWCEYQVVHFDANVPQLGVQTGSREVVIFEDESAVTGAASASDVTDAATSAKKTYASDMYLSNVAGQWYFILSAEDGSGIQEIVIKESVGGNTASIICDATWTSGETAGVKKVGDVIFVDSNWAYNEVNGVQQAKSYTDKWIYLPVDTSSDGYISYTITAYEGTDTKLYSSGIYTFNIDNSAPTLTTITSEDTRISNTDKLVAGNKLVNSNGGYVSLSSTVDDSGSGFDKLALYFIRDTSKNGEADTIYNPYPTGSSAAWTTTDASAVSVSGLNQADNLYGKSVDGTIDGDNNTFTASIAADISANENIRVGGLAKINGSYYIITAVSGGVVTVKADTALISNGNGADTVFFPYAFVVQYDLTWQNKETWTSDSNNYSTETYTITEDDEDGIMQTVEKSGTTWKWTLYIPSAAIPDGTIDIRWTAFDKAGNSENSSVSTMISNSLPRLSKVFLATDLNGGGSFEDAEYSYTKVSSSGIEVSYWGYSAENANGEVQEVVTLDTDYTYLANEGDTIGTTGLYYVRSAFDAALEFTSGGDSEISYIPSLAATAATEPATGAPRAGTLSPFTATTNVDAQKHISLTSFTGLSGYAADMENTADNVKSTNGKSPVKTYLTLSLWDNVNIDEDDTANSVFIATKDVTDGTTGLVTTYGNQFTVVNIPLYIDMTDDNAPEVEFNTPTAVEDEGHVDIGDDTIFTGDDELDADDKISGKVVFTGTIQDDRKIETLTLKSNYAINSTLTNAVTVAEYDNETSLLKVKSAASTTTGWTFSITTADSSQFSLATGHTVEWRLELDSTYVENVAQSDVEFTLTANDGTNDGATPKQVDIVPYITDISSGDMESGTKKYLRRSASGAFVANVDDTENASITVKGYNLTGGTVYLGDTAKTTVASGDDLTVKKSLLTNSGAIKVINNSVESLNNSNDNTAECNKEASQFAPNHTDDRYIYMWDTTTTTYSGSEAVMKPVLNANGVKTGAMKWYYAYNNQYLYADNQQLTTSWAGAIYGGNFAYNGSGSPSWIFLHNMNWTSGLTDYTAYGSVQWAKGFQNMGRATAWNRERGGLGYPHLGLGNLSFGSNTQGYSYNTAIMKRYENLKLIVSGNDTDTLNMVAYFDKADESRSIVFWRFHEGTDITYKNLRQTNNSYTDMSRYVEETYAYSSPYQTSVGLDTPAGREEITSGKSDSAYFDMAYDSVMNVVYIAYYDEVEGALKIRYLNNPAAGYYSRWTNTWQTAVTIDPDAAGLYVTMKTDARGRIHLAYYDTTGSYLKYALLTPSGTSGAVTGFTVTKKVLVDTLFTNGMYNSITLKDFSEDEDGSDVRPVITSYSISYGGTKYSLRTSWPLTTVENIEAGATADDGYTGKWETVVVVSANAPTQDNTYTETNGTGYTGNIVVGYTASKLEQAVLLGE